MGGRYRAMARWYFDQRQPFYVRNLPFAALPFGLMFACWVLHRFIWSTRASRNRVCSRFALPQVWICLCRSRRSRTSAPTSVIWVARVLMSAVP